jgi:hypothetical protein
MIGGFAMMKNPEKSSTVMDFTFSLFTFLFQGDGL